MKKKKNKLDDIIADIIIRRKIILCLIDYHQREAVRAVGSLGQGYHCAFTNALGYEKMFLEKILGEYGEKKD